MKYSELAEDVKGIALDQAFDAWWAHNYEKYAENVLVDYMVNFLETTGLGVAPEFVEWEVLPERVSHGQGDGTAKLIYHEFVGYGDDVSIADDGNIESKALSGLVDALLAYTEESGSADLIYDSTDADGNLEFAFDAEKFDELLEKACKKAEFQFFNWDVDVCESAFDWMREAFNDGEGEVDKFDFASDGTLLEAY